MGLRIRLTKLLIAAAATFAAAGARAQGSATATTNGSASISAPASIRVSQNLSFTVLPQLVNSGLTITSSALNGVNANVQLTGDQTASLSVPDTFDVTRVGGTEIITVHTVGPITSLTGATGRVAAAAKGGVFGNPGQVIGVFDGGALSFTVGGQVTLASDLVPGEYQGVLTMVAQYN